MCAAEARKREVSESLVFGTGFLLNKRASTRHSLVQTHGQSVPSSVSISKLAIERTIST
jgi:hypothetical protein